MISILTLFTGSVLAQTSNKTVGWQDLELAVTEMMTEFKTVGLAIAVVNKDQVIYTNGFGYRDLGKELPVDPHTLFPIGSVTKSLTASLVGVYAGKGKLSLDDLPRKHIGNIYFYSDEMNKLVTLEDLLAHRSGIGNVDATHVFFPTKDLDSHLERLAYLTPNSKVRERFDYSNMGYAILGGVTEKISGRSWAANIKKELFEPLRMPRSNCSISSLQQDENYSLGYSIQNGEAIRVLLEDQHESVASGAINSSVTELANWVRMLLNEGSYGAQQIVPKTYLEQAFSEHNIIRGSFSYDQKYDLLGDAYGYAWFVHQYKGLYRVSHGGNVSGFTAQVSLYPHQDIGIIILSNQGGANLLIRAIEDIIMNQLLGLAQKSWKDYRIEVGQARTIPNELKPLNQGKAPSHPLADYVGTYQHPGYGTVQVTLEKDQLYIHFPAFKMALEHLHYDTFINRLISSEHQNTPSFYMDFKKDFSGKINGLSVALQRKPVLFEKIG